MLTEEDKRIAHRQIDELRRKAPKVTREHRDKAGKLLEQHKANEAEKDRDIRRELKDFSKELAGFAHNHINGVGTLFHGMGDGKRPECSFCGRHESTMHNMKDGKWYCGEHKRFGDLSEEQKREEQECLSTSRTKK